MALPGITVFIGGPKDTRDDRRAVHDFVTYVLARHYKDRLLLAARHFDHPTQSVAPGYGEDWQDRIDSEINPAEQDVGIILFRWRLGHERRYKDVDYPSMSAYEAECFLTRAVPAVAIFRYGEEFRPNYPPDLFQLPAEQRDQIINTIKADSDEYKRLDTYLADLKARYPKLAVPTYSDPQQLLSEIESFLHSWLERFLQENAQSSNKSPDPRDQRNFPGWPFKSFASLTDKDHEIFFGREDEISEILRRLDDPAVRFVCIRGPSGAGKSSLLQAGVLPPLLDPRLAAKRRIRYRPGTIRFLFTPDKLPFTNLANTVRLTEHQPLYGTPAPVLAEQLESACDYDVPKAVAAIEKWLVRPCLSDAHPDGELLIVVDQAEELWTRCSEEMRRKFLLFMAAAVETPRVRVFVTLRGDLAKSFEEVDLVAKLLNRSRACCSTVLSSPDVKTLALMIEGPVAYAKLEADQGLIGSILAEAQRIGGASLPLVSHALNILSREGGGGRLKLESYKAMNGLSGAVQASLERAGSVPDSQLPPLFDLLYETRNGVPVRRVVSRQELTELGPAIWTSIERLIDARILVGGVAPDAKRFDHVQLAHDALFEGWPRLHDWIQEHRRDLEIRDELSRDAERWERHGRRGRLIRLRPEALKEVLDLERDKPYLFRRHPVTRRYLAAADELLQRELLIANLKGGHLGAALDAYRLGARLQKEDRGDEPNQLRAAFHAAVTGDDRVDEDFFAPETSFVRKPDARSVYDDPKTVHATLSRGLEPIDFAAMFGHVDLVKKLIEKGASANHRSAEGSTLMSYAAYGGQLAMVRYLAEELGVPCDVQEDNGATPLIWALHRGEEEISAYLISRGADLSASVKQGFNALTEAVRGGKLVLLRRVLDDQRFGVNDQLPSGVSPLGVACQTSGPDPMLRANALSVAEELISRGARINGGESGISPLQLAAQNGFSEMAQLLLKHGADSNISDPYGSRPLHSAAIAPSSATLRILLSHNADPNVLDPSGNTALSLAAREGRDENVELLLEAKADPNLKSGKAWTALQYAAYDGDVAIVELLLARGADIDLATHDRWTALHLAVQKGHREIVQTLLDRGADPNLRTDGDFTALRLAASHAHEAIIRMLAEQHADIDARDSEGRTPLHGAAANGHAEVVSLLLDLGADIGLLSSAQESALALAVNRDSSEVVQILLMRGAALDTASASRLAVLRAIPEPDNFQDALAMLSAFTPTWGSQAEAGAALGWTRTVRRLVAAGAAEPASWKQRRASELARFLTFTEFDLASEETVAAAMEFFKRRFVGNPDQRRFRRAALDCFPGCSLVAVEELSTPGANEQFLLSTPGIVRLLDWQNTGIYAAAETGLLYLEDDASIRSYCLFFLHWVRSILGRFVMVESEDHIQWTEPPSEQTKANVSSQLRPLRIIDRTENEVRLNATCVFKSGLFATDILIATRNFETTSDDGITQGRRRGELQLTNEDLLLEDLPFVIYGPPGIFG